MSLSENIKFNSNALSHHAYCIIGGDDARSDLISLLEKKHHFAIHGNPDFFEKKYESFTIDDARELKAMHETMPAGKSGKKIFVISMNAITSEAQNALLKLLEEPAEYAHFFLIIPSSHLLLPTVKSRLSFIGSGSSALTNGYSDEAKIFVISSIAKRLEQIKKLAEEITKEKKTRHDAIELLDAIQAVVFEERGPKEGEQALSCIETARKYINDRSPSVKMLLEHVALNI